MAYKTFTAGEVLTASDLNSYLMKQSVIVCTAATRPSGPNEGMTIYETDTDQMLTYSGSAWVPAVRIGAWSSYTPTLTNWTVGDGTFTTKYTQIGSLVHYQGRFTVGSTTAIGASNSFTVTLPVTGVSSEASIGDSWAFDTSAPLRVACLVTMASSTTMQIRYGTTAVGSVLNFQDWKTGQTPFLIATGDELYWSLTYQAA